MRDLILLLIIIGSAGPLILESCGLLAQSDDATFPPHLVVGNIYYVGSKILASYLVTTEQGHILINSGYEHTVPLIQTSIQQLGFPLHDIKILLTSHAHNDHAAGHALIRRLTGARVLVMEGDEDLIRSGGKGDFHYEDSWEPCPVDRVLKDRDEVQLGSVTLVARRTPGHTKGCTTWTLRTNEGGKTYQVVIVGSPNVNPGYRLVRNSKYPTIAEDFARTFQVLKALPCEVFLGAHGGYYGLEEKYARLRNNDSTNPFLDPEGYRRFVALKEKEFLDELARQKHINP